LLPKNAGAGSGMGGTGDGSGVGSGLGGSGSGSGMGLGRTSGPAAVGTASGVITTPIDPEITFVEFSTTSLGDYAVPRWRKLATASPWFRYHCQSHTCRLDCR